MESYYYDYIDNYMYSDKENITQLEELLVEETQSVLGISINLDENTKSQLQKMISQGFGTKTYEQTLKLYIKAIEIVEEKLASTVENALSIAGFKTVSNAGYNYLCDCFALTPVSGAENIQNQLLQMAKGLGFEGDDFGTLSQGMLGSTIEELQEVAAEMGITYEELLKRITLQYAFDLSVSVSNEQSFSFLPAQIPGEFGRNMGMSDTYSFEITQDGDYTFEAANSFGNLTGELTANSVQLLTGDAGAFDAEGNLVYSWDTLINTYGFDFERDYEIWTETQLVPGYLMRNNEDFKDVTKLVLAKTITRIGQSALAVSTLEEIVVPRSVTSIGNLAFGDSENLKKVTLTEGLQTIGIQAFSNCTSLQSIIIPNSVTSVEERAFVGCTNLTNVTLPESLTVISDGLFSGCTNLETITIPGSVTTIESLPFSECSKLTSIKYDGNLDDWNNITKEDQLGRSYINYSL